MGAEPQARYVSVSKAAARLGMSSEVLRRWCREGHVSGARKLRGKHWRIPESGLDALLVDSQ